MAAHDWKLRQFVMRFLVALGLLIACLWLVAVFSTHA
jgi:hypothetical protein